jgi:hypothetical protein
MSLAETAFRSLVSAMGVTPEAMQEALQFFFTELRTIKAEREAFKVGAGQMVAMFQARLDAQDRQLANMERKLNSLLDLDPDYVSPLIPYGETHDIGPAQPD